MSIPSTVITSRNGKVGSRQLATASSFLATTMTEPGRLNRVRWTNRLAQLWQQPDVGLTQPICCPDAEI